MMKTAAGRPADIADIQALAAHLGLTEPSERLALVEEPISWDALRAAYGEQAQTLRRWAAFCAAMVEWLCQQDALPFPLWTQQQAFILPEPWFLYPGDALIMWRIAQTPAPFKARNIFGDEQMLSRA